MSTEEPESPVSPPLPPAPVTQVGKTAVRTGWILPAALGAGIVATVLTWQVGEMAVAGFRPKATGNMAMGPLFGHIEADELVRVEARNAALTYGLQGAILGVMLGLAGAIARGSLRAGVPAALAGLVLGAGLGSMLSLGVFPVLESIAKHDPENIIPPLIAHASVWGLVGAAAGLAFGLGLGGRGQVVRAAIGGLVGALLGTVAYELIGAGVFPMDKTSSPVAATVVPRLVAHACVNVLVALGAAMFASSTGRPASK